MEFLAKFSAEAQAAISHLFLRILCLLIIEYDCARLVQESSGMPAIRGNYVLASLYALGFILCVIMPDKRLGYIIGMGAGTINVLIKVYIVFAGHEHFPYYPFVWIPQSLLVIYFCYKAFKKTR